MIEMKKLFPHEFETAFIFLCGSMTALFFNSQGRNKTRTKLETKRVLPIGKTPDSFHILDYSSKSSISPSSS